MALIGKNRELAKEGLSVRARPVGPEEIMQPKPHFHVASLVYKLRPKDNVTYRNPPPMDFETEQARFRLSDGKLSCEMKTHFPTAEEARAVVEPILRAWEADADLRWNRGELRFEFERADIIDRSPIPLGVIRGSGQCVARAAVMSGVARVHVERDRYPEPPGTFRITPDAESILLRYHGYLDGREPLLSMAYFCLTVLQVGVGGRDVAAAKYRIEKDVLNKVGELTSRRGDRATARKVVVGTVQPLSEPERGWLECAIRMLIWWLGDTRPPTAIPIIAMGDLPNL